MFYDKKKFNKDHEKLGFLPNEIENALNKHEDIGPEVVIEDDESADSESIEVAKDDESADIEFIDSKSKKDEDEREEIPDLYSDLNSNNGWNAVRPPQSVHVEGVSKEEVAAFWSEWVSDEDRFDASNMPSADSQGLVYMMNYIFLPYEQMLSVFLLTSEYLDPKHGLHAWPSKKRRKELPDLYANLRSTIYAEYKQTPSPFACAFRVDSDGDAQTQHLWISKVDFVPNNTTRDRYVNYGTEIMRCDVPMAAMHKYFDGETPPFYDEDYKFEFLLTQKWRHLVPESHRDYRSEMGEEGES